MIEKVAAFVPAADEVSRLQRDEGAECALFREIGEQGHYKGRVQPTNTRQGIYAAAPSGRLLASINTRRAAAVGAMLDEPLEVWAAMPDEERWLSDEELAADPGWRFESNYPADGLVLTVMSRDLPRDDRPPDWRAHAWNLDRAWFRADELARLIPADAEVGATSAAPAVARRLAALHLVDNVRGQVRYIRDEDVTEATLEVEVVAAEHDALRLALRGRTRAETAGTWSVNGFRDMRSPSEQVRGVELALRGTATWDRRAGRFESFDLVASGERWGGTQYNARHDDLDRGPIGFVLEVAPADDRVAPAAWWRYGW